MSNTAQLIENVKALKVALAGHIVYDIVYIHMKYITAIYINIHGAVIIYYVTKLIVNLCFLSCNI